MSKDHHNSGLYVDVGLLRDHISKLREQKKLASGLYENIAFMRSAADPETAYRYDPVLRDIERMMEYFDAMAKLLAETADEATLLSHELRGMIRDSADLTLGIVNANIAL